MSTTTLRPGPSAVLAYLNANPGSWYTNYAIMRCVASMFPKPPAENTFAAWTRELRDANLIESKKRHVMNVGTVLVYRAKETAP